MKWKYPFVSCLNARLKFPFGETNLTNSGCMSERCSFQCRKWRYEHKTHLTFFKVPKTDRPNLETVGIPRRDGSSSRDAVRAAPGHPGAPKSTTRNPLPKSATRHDETTHRPTIRPTPLPREEWALFSIHNTPEKAKSCLLDFLGERAKSSCFLLPVLFFPSSSAKRDSLSIVITSSAFSTS